MHLEYRSYEDIARCVGAKNISSISQIITKIRNGKIDIEKIRYKQFKHINEIELKLI
jgi:phosphotransferase system IIB component